MNTLLVMMIGAATLGVATPALSETLSGAEVTQLLAGQKARWQSTDGKIKGTAAYGANGTVKVTGNFRGFDSDAGKWWVEGNNFCAAYKKIRNGETACGPVKVVGKGTYQINNSVFVID